MSFRRSAFPGNFRKFLEISGGRRSAVGGRLRSAVGLPPPEVKFPWKFLDPCFLSRGQISKRISRNLCQGQSAPLVERLLDDLTKSNERQTELALLAEKRANEIAVAEQHVLPVRKENTRLVRENNELHMQIIADAEAAEAA